MTDERERAPEEPRGPATGGPRARLFEEMMSRCAEMMPHMMAMCGGAQKEKEATDTDATGKA